MRCEDVTDSVIQGFTFQRGLTPPSGPWYEICGAGLACVDSDPTLVNIVFRNNFGHLYGGGMSCHGSSPTLTNVFFVENHVGVTGMGGSGGGLSGNLSSSIQLTNVSFRGNFAVGDGGGAHFTGAPTLTRCLFEGNEAEWGGGLSGVGEPCAPMLTDVILAGNIAYGGGGMTIQSNATASLMNVTVVGNAADYASGVDISQNSTVTFESVTVALNSPDIGIGCFLSPEPSLACCNVFGNEGGDWEGCISAQYGANGNISADPLFCDLTGGDYGLCEDSPCAPDNHPSGVPCGLIGALGVTCDPCGQTPVESVSWGSIKGFYR
jgi:hypothetical protein